jgi:hypothetical protein
VAFLTPRQPAVGAWGTPLAPSRAAARGPRQGPLWQARGVTDAFTTALIAELGKKTGVCWLRYADPESIEGGAPRTRAAWHVWYDDALYVVAGGGEQPLPGIADAERVEVIMRSKESGGRLVTWVGRPSVVTPEDGSWDDVTSALVSDRLNLADLSTAKQGWAQGSDVVRVEPTGELLEEPGSLGDDDHAAPPPGTEATTRGDLPRVLHRRKRRRPGLS